MERAGPGGEEAEEQRRADEEIREAGEMDGGAEQASAAKPATAAARGTGASARSATSRSVASIAASRGSDRYWFQRLVEARIAAGWRVRAAAATGRAAAPRVIAAAKPARARR